MSARYIPKVYIRGCGVVSSLGRGLAAQREALASGRSRPEALVLDDLDERRGSYLYHRVDRPAGPDRLRGMAHDAMDDALANACLSDGERRKAALFVGTSSSEIGESEWLYEQDVRRGEPDFPMRVSGHGRFTSELCRAYGFYGGEFLFSTACSSSANALIYAFRMIRAGLLDDAVVLGTECFNKISLYGFDALMLASDAPSRPFDRDRRGLVLGEGVAALVLSSRPAPRAERPVYVLGGSNLCDTTSATNSSPQAVADVMREALTDSGVHPSQVRAVKAHGTSTPTNDLVEGQAMCAVFDDPPPFTSLKSMIGHTLGACGALETAGILACLDAGFFPPTANFENPMDDLPIAPVASPRPVEPGHFLLNFFGFGGNNSSLVISNDS